MISWLKGDIIEIDDNDMVVSVGGVGYLVTIGSNLQREQQWKKGERLELAVYTSVKEDGIHLFGFSDFFSRKVFLLLLNVNGVGPKLALSIVDQLGAGNIIRALRRSDADSFIRVSGVGRKTAQRIILDLQGKMEVLQFQDISQGAQEEEDRPEDNQKREQLFADAVSALSNLGFSVRESEKVIAQHLPNADGFDELLRKCLTDLKK